MGIMRISHCARIYVYIITIHVYIIPYMYTHMGNMGVSEHGVYVRNIPKLWQF